MDFTDVYSKAQHDRYLIVYPYCMDNIKLNDWVLNDTNKLNLMYFTITDKKMANYLYERFTNKNLEDLKEAEITIEASNDINHTILAATIGKVEDDSVIDIDDILNDFDLLKALVYREIEAEKGIMVSNLDAILAVLDDETKKKYGFDITDSEMER